MRPIPNWTIVAGLAFVLLFASLAVPFSYRWLAWHIDLPVSHPLAAVVLIEGVLAIAAIGLAFFTLTYRRPERLRNLPARLMVRSFVASIAAAVVFVALFCAATLSITANPESPVVSAVTGPPALASQGEKQARPPANAVAWVQFSPSPSSHLMARALVGMTDDCPEVRIGAGQPQSMIVRPRALDTIFGKICEAKLPPVAQVTSVRIAYRGQSPLLDHKVTDAPAKIVVLGDTGCRITHYDDQGCNSHHAWPFPTIAHQAERTGPDLVVHVGDYFYREAPCRRDSVNCIPNAYMDREATWRADFFEPARELLRAAPWIFVRGNHEDCQRGGYGWFHYFGDGVVACEPAHEAAYLPFKGLTVVHFDTAHADDPHAVNELNDKWETLKSGLRKRLLAETDAATPVLLLTHKPGIALCEAPRTDPPPGRWESACDPKSVAGVGGVRNIVEAVRSAGRRAIVLGGDIHVFQVLDVVPIALSPDKSVTQLIVGNGGSKSSEDYEGLRRSPDPIKVRFDDSRLAAVDRNGEKKWEAGPPSEVTATAQVWQKPGFAVIGVNRTSGTALSLGLQDAAGNRQLTCDLTSELGAAAARCQP